MEGGVHAGEGASEYYDAVVFAEGEFADGGYLIVGSEAGDGLLEESELDGVDGGVRLAGTSAAAVAPCDVANPCEDAADVGEAGAEEYDATDEGALLVDYLFADGACDFLNGIEEFDGREAGFEDVEAEEEFGVSDMWPEAHGIPTGGVIEEKISYQ